MSDGIIAPGYAPEALDILRQKRKGAFSVIQIDPDYTPAVMETREIFGITFTQRFNDAVIDESLLKNIVTKNKDLPECAARDLLVALITLKYTQSNSVCLAKDGQAIGIGAGQQSRVHCVRLAANKADMWHLRHREKTLNLPFRKDVGRAARDNAIEAFLLEGAGIPHRFLYRHAVGPAGSRPCGRADRRGHPLLWPQPTGRAD